MPLHSRNLIMLFQIYMFIFMNFAMTSVTSVLVRNELGRMSLEQFQSTVHTFVDDEMTFLQGKLNRMKNLRENILEERSAFELSRRIQPKTGKREVLHQKGRSNQMTKGEIPQETLNLFDNIVSHGWEALSGSLEEVPDNHKNESLFLTCYSSSSVLDSNDRLQEILIATGNSRHDIFFDTVHSSFEKLCVIIPIQVDLALSWYSSKGNTNNNITLVPWVDLMKITPYIISQIFDTADSSYTTSYKIGFSIMPTSNEADVNAVLRSVIDMARRGQTDARQLKEKGNQEDHRTYPPKSIHDTFSITRTLKKVGKTSLINSSAMFWSRVLKEGLESDHGCESMMNMIEIKPSSISSAYEFLIPIQSEECILSFIVGLAVQPSVTHIGAVAYSVNLHNLDARWVTQGSVRDTRGNHMTPWTDAGLDGTGQIVAISDTGLDIDNCYFRDETSIFDNDKNSIFQSWVLSKRKIVRYAIDPDFGDEVDTLHGHGTHVAATIIGSHINGRVFGANKEGISPGARAHFYDICVEKKCFSPQKTWFESFTPNANTRIASGSWGTKYLPSYDWTCRNYDKLLLEHPDVLLVSSAGNDGDLYEDNPFFTVSAPASCKNTLAVGATLNTGFGSPFYVASFSGRGPSSDGRIKPDILAPGYKLDSATSGNHDCYTKEPEFFLAGTSMAAPLISGTAVLVRQYFIEGWYPCGSKGCGSFIQPSGSLLKAVLINGAQFLEGVVDPYSNTILTEQPLSPYDNTQGFGALNLLSSLPLKNENDFNVYIRNDVPLSRGLNHSFVVNMNKESCKSDFSVTLTWYDPPGSIGCTKCIVNDLDLLLEDMDSLEQYYPNGKSTPDKVNNVERTRISKSPLSRQYRVTVISAGFGPGLTRQLYSLVATGCFNQPDENVSMSTPYKSQPISSVSTPTAVSGKVQSRRTEYQLTTSSRMTKNKKKTSGVMFSIKARVNGIRIESFSFQTSVERRNIKVQVYKLNTIGGFNGTETFLNDPSKWIMISPIDGFQIDAMGLKNPTTIPRAMFEVYVPQGSTQTFYLTFINEREMICKQPRKNMIIGSPYRRDNNIELFRGIAKDKFSGRNDYLCMMEGAVMYSVDQPL